MAVARNSRRLGFWPFLVLASFRRHLRASFPTENATQRLLGADIARGGQIGEHLIEVLGGLPFEASPCCGHGWRRPPVYGGGYYGGGYYGGYGYRHGYYGGPYRHGVYYRGGYGHGGFYHGGYRDTAGARIMAVTGDGSLVDARLGSTAMDTNIRLAILVLIFLFGGLVRAGALLLRRRRAQVEATSFHEQ